MNQKTTPAYLFVISLFLVAGFATMVAVAKNDNSNGNTSGGTESSNSKSDKSSEKAVETKANTKTTTQTKTKTTATELKTYKKADETKGETNANVHKEKTTEMIKNLEQASVQEQTRTNNDAKGEAITTENAGVDTNIQVKNEAKKKIQEVVAEQTRTQEQTTTAIEEVENDGAVKKLILGPDYKNLGQLRSELVQNRNQIRKLTQAMATLTQNGEDTTALSQNLVLLTNERQRIRDIIAENQDSFSFLGWMARFFNNYEETPVNEAEEEELIAEVEEAIENSDTSDETSTTPETATTPETTTDPTATPETAPTTSTATNPDTTTTPDAATLVQ